MADGEGIGRYDGYVGYDRYDRYDGYEERAIDGQVQELIELASVSSFDVPERTRRT
jgi:hypothetical protein